MDQAGYVYLSMHGEFLIKVDPFKEAFGTTKEINKAYFTRNKCAIKGGVAVRAIRSRSVVVALVRPDKATNFVLVKDDQYYSITHGYTSIIDLASLFNLKSPPITLYYDHHHPLPVEVVDNIILDIFGDKH